MEKEWTTISYPRSGSNFVRAVLSKYYGYTVCGPGLAHARTPYNIRPEELKRYKDNLNAVYVVRDARDALISNYYWITADRKGRGRYSQHFITDNFNNLTFSDFLHGKARFEFNEKWLKVRPQFEEMFYRQYRDKVVEYWVEHTDWIVPKKQNWMHEVIKYEDAINKWVIKDLINPGKGSKGTVGRWKKYFSSDDLEYFWSIAGDRMTELGYSKND